MADRRSTTSKTTEDALWSEQAWCANVALSYYQRISVKAGYTWAWRVKNTFVEVSDECDACDSSCLEKPRRFTTPSVVGRYAAGKEQLEQLAEDACQVCTGPEGAEGQQGGAGVSIGSLGHPLLCSGACARIAEGCCPLGAACSFCHHPRCVARRKQLDKKNRGAFRQMGVRRKIYVMAAILQEKIAKLGLGSRGVWALEQWRRESLSGLPQQEEECRVKKAEERRVVNTLKSMSISDICFLPCPRDDVFREATESLLSRLRHVSSTSRRDCALACR